MGLPNDYHADTRPELAGLLRHDHLRMVAVFAVQTVLMSLFLPAWMPILFAVVLTIGLALNGRLIAQYLIRPTPARFHTISALMFVTSVVYCIPVHFLWRDLSTEAHLLAICMLAGVLLNVALLRSAHLTWAIASLVPVVITALSLPLVYWDGALNRGFVVSSLALLLVCVTFTAALFANHQRATALARASRAAEAASAAKGRFLATMSHEIRTPLNGILGLAQIMFSEAQTSKQAEQGALLLHAAQDLKTIVDDVLDFAKIEAGMFEIRPARYTLREEVEQTVKLFQARAAEKSLRLKLSFKDNLPEEGMFDALRMRQCLSNLVSNAIKYTELGGIVVTVGAVQNDEKCLVRIAVSDTGSGIAPHQLPHLFGSFVQVNEEKTRGIEGTGLGLAITRQLAELMGGRATVKSALNQGSEFTFSFLMNAVDADAPDADDPLSRDNRVGPLRLLIVDDVATNRFVARAFLRNEGHMIQEASGGVEALRLIENDTFDAILLDMHMPEVDGRETLRRLRNMPPPNGDIPVIALTADDPETLEPLMADLNLSGFVAKPVERAALAAELSRVLGPMRLAEVNDELRERIAR